MYSLVKCSFYRLVPWSAGGLVSGGSAQATRLGWVGLATSGGNGGVMVGGYTIRYRSTKALGMPALVVEDLTGTAYLFIAQVPQVRVGGEHASERLVGLLG